MLGDDDAFALLCYVGVGLWGVRTWEGHAPHWLRGGLVVTWHEYENVVEKFVATISISLLKIRSLPTRDHAIRIVSYLADYFPVT